VYVCVCVCEICIPVSSLRPIDVEFMQRLHHCVNIVPVIGKSDTLTIEERELFKQRVSPPSLDQPWEWLDLSGDD